MMVKAYLKLLLSFLFVGTLWIQAAVDCRTVVGTIAECEPFSHKFLKAKKIRYVQDRQKPIVKKTLPVPVKIAHKIISIEDIIEKYIKIEDSIRFKGSVDLPYFDDMTKSKIHVEKGLYTIQKGDRLSQIAIKFNMPLVQLTTLNHLKKTSAIRVGKTMIIPYSQKKIDAITKGEYIIETGDSLGSIAKDFNLTVSMIKKFNILKKNKILWVGQKLTLPVPHKLPELRKKQKILMKKKELQRKKEIKIRKKRFAHKARKVKMIRGFGRRKMRVTATAYSSHRRQTDRTPFLAAWNNRLRPGMKIIAVSRDLLTRYGLRNGSKVKIGGLSGYYTVRDKMNKRFRKRIDIYMGINRRRALRWGRRSVMLYW